MKYLIVMLFSVGTILSSDIKWIPIKKTPSDASSKTDFNLSEVKEVKNVSNLLKGMKIIMPLLEKTTKKSVDKSSDKKWFIIKKTD